MTTAAFSLEQQLLTLALAAYAGAASPSQSAAPITAALASLGPLEGHWQLAWGPAFHRPRFALLDDSVMFVARYERSHRYAVVIRGTNPVSAPDWILGDLWAAHDRPWATGAAGERVSLSSSLGLCVLQHLRAEPADDARGFTSAILKALAGDALAPLSGAARATITGLRDAAQ
ncbi:MAG: hypothetical protein JWM10_2847, partial [Myxococcaceae bacterium]|nr:hypothetical protein [Myxococcaceae bacterium]